MTADHGYEWVYQAPRWRTVLVVGRPTRLFWPHLAFHRNAVKIGNAYSPSLFAFALEGPPTSHDDLLDKLRYFPFTAYNRFGEVLDMSHVDRYGSVCFDGEACDLMMYKGRDAIDVFWNSGFSVFDAETLRAWRDASEADVVALRPFPGTTGMRSCGIPADTIKFVRTLQYSRAPWLPEEAKP